MLLVVCLLFIIAVIFGLRLLLLVFQGRSTPKFIVIAHGAFALTALSLLVSYVMRSDHHWVLIVCMSLFIMAALGGLTMLKMDLSKQQIPKLIATFHPLLAIIALIILIGYATQPVV